VPDIFMVHRVDICIIRLIFYASLADRT